MLFALASQMFAQQRCPFISIYRADVLIFIPNLIEARSMRAIGVRVMTANDDGIFCIGGCH